MIKVIGLAIGILALSGLALVIVSGQAGMTNRDWFTYWAGGRGVLESANLYRTDEWLALHNHYGSTWFPNPVFIYAPPTAILFAPLAALRVDIAAVIWVWLSQIFIVASVALVAVELKWRRLPRYAFLWLIGILSFLPVLLTLLMGQASALILLVVTTTAVLWNRGRWFLGGVWLGLTIVKPQAVVLLVLGLGVWLVVKKRWDALTGMALSFGASALATFALFPNFISDWMASVTSKVSGVADRMPTVWGLMADVFGASPLAFGSALMITLLVVVATVAAMVKWKEQNALVVTGMLILPSLIVTPYLWNYDQMLILLPLLTALIMLDRLGVSYRLLVWVPLLVSVFGWGLFAISALRVRDTFGVLLPVFVGLLLWYVVRRSTPMQLVEDR